MPGLGLGPWSWACRPGPRAPAWAPGPWPLGVGHLPQPLGPGPPLAASLPSLPASPRFDA
eukprot:CAMPEP_0195139264 /NCGR_PEP_ID=MMETSP0448-20130528/159082_1 /TAXON_ID=66468 /ORGANISM="Heterocapsa triquestra, Strain CCMP 448" /LENGTH=59 /DNA_ID=CAMNT_0040177567 /DNA_START=21 /DNA_END=197 /DNA_ORIENTATION=-